MQYSYDLFGEDFVEKPFSYPIVKTRSYGNRLWLAHLFFSPYFGYGAAIYEAGGGEVPNCHLHYPGGKNIRIERERWGKNVRPEEKEISEVVIARERSIVGQVEIPRSTV